MEKTSGCHSPVMELSGSKSSRRRRPALGDITNVVASSSSTEAASVKHRSSRPKTEKKSTLRVVPGETSVRLETSVVIGTCNSRDHDSREGVPPTSVAEVVETSANSVGDQHNLGPSRLDTLQSAKKRKSKWKADADVLQSSYPPVERIGSIGLVRDNLNIEHEDVDRQITHSVPYRKPKKKRRHTMSKDVVTRSLTLPPDFVEKQKAYFAEVDAFELQEELVSESELE